ncbi:hypothetical protein GOV12_01520 [Candidatus Pacearchaeota archaeon]|nr:hypothetical protein [Candidatus Pacearchaeota archaeon]
MKKKIILIVFIIILIIILILFIDNFYNLNSIDKSLNNTYEKCLIELEIPDKYFENEFLVFFDVNTSEDEINNFINNTGLIARGIKVNYDSYFIGIAKEEIPEKRYMKTMNTLISNLELIPEVKHVGDNRGAIGVKVEFYKNVSSNKSREIIDSIIESKNLSFAVIEFQGKNSFGNIEIPEGTGLTEIEWVCKFKQYDIVNDAGLNEIHLIFTQII